MPSSVKPSDKLMEMLVMECEERNIALALIGSNEAGVCLILLGRRDMSPDQASIIAADLLLQGVISGGFHQENADKAAENSTPISKDKVN